MNLPLPTGEVDFVSERSEFTKSGEGSIVKVIHGTKSNCHAELVSASVRGETLKQVQGDNVVLAQHDNPCVIASVQRNVAIASKRSFAFTLSEVLIVLAVLGVVAAMTIPDLIQDYREKALITALKKNYTVFSQAVDMAIADNGPMDTWDIGQYWSQDGTLKLYNILKPYLKIQEDCGLSAGCFADHYEALFNTNFGYSSLARLPYFARGVLSSGASFYVLSQGTGCRQVNSCGYMCVDVNGKKGPNKAGVDLFYFTFYKTGELIPDGQRRSSGLCTYNDSGTNNGMHCAYWALKHENMDYLRKAGCYFGYCK